jgi:hypothetical protein
LKRYALARAHFLRPALVSSCPIAPAPIAALDAPDAPVLLRVPKSSTVLQLALIADEDFITFLKESTRWHGSFHFPANTSSRLVSRFESIVVAMKNSFWQKSKSTTNRYFSHISSVELVPFITATNEEVLSGRSRRIKRL